jgi:uncharacterized membrane protein YkvA (DUF1232 family)
MAMNKAIYNTILVAVVALGLTYVFLGSDIIPDSVSVALPGMILGWVDDAVVILGLVFFLAKIKQRMIGGKGSPGIGPWGWVLTIGVVTAVLLYIFLPVDILPDGWPWVGFMDDAAAAIIGLVVVQRIRRRAK